MIAINEEMGFRPQHAFQNWRRDFDKTGDSAGQAAG